MTVNQSCSIISLVSKNSEGENATNATQATNVIKGFVRQIGLGFHVDTPMSEYLDANGKELFHERQAIDSQWWMDQACETLDALNIDPCEIALSCCQGVN